MSQATLNGTVRETFGSKASQAARKQGQVPMTISRPGQDSLHILVGEKEAELIADQSTQKFSITIDGKAVDVVLKEVKRHVTNDRLQHIDLIGVNDDSVVIMNIPVRPITTNCPGIKAGGLLEQSLRRVAIKCQVKNLPEFLKVDLAEVQVDETVYVKNCSLPEGASFVTKPNVAMISILRTRGMKKAETEAAKEG